MIDIAKPLTNFVIYNGKKIKLNISFDTVLKMYDIFKDGILLEQEKAQFALALLVKGSKIPDFKVLDIIFKEQIETFQRQSSSNQLRVVDFKQDSSYIYSSFLMDYGIDLIEQQGKLHWQKFISLFQGLSEKTKYGKLCPYVQDLSPSLTSIIRSIFIRLWNLKLITLLKYRRKNENVIFRRA